MRFILFGSPIFARLVLEQLAAAKMLPAAVVCNPDRPSGRDQSLTPPEIKRYIVNNDLPIEILQPEDPSTIVPRLASLSPDFFLVSAYAKILKPDILSVPRLGTIGIHSSLLPKYRGTTPIQSAILAGEKETGATLYMIDEKMDHGPILAQVIVPINAEDTHQDIFPKIWQGGGQKLVEILPGFLSGDIKPETQDESRATYTKKLTTEDGFVDENDLREALRGDNLRSVHIHRKIRALNPDPGVWSETASELSLGRATISSGKRVKLLAARLENNQLHLTMIQIEGKQPLTLK